MSQLQTNKSLLAALVLSVLVTAFLITAISFEFFVEELAKAYVVPILVAATFTSFGLIAMLVRSSTSV